MIKQFIETNNAPKAIGTYSQGITYDRLVFTSGQIPIDLNTGKLIDGGFKVEVEQVLNNLDGVLSAGNSCLDNILKLTVFLTDLSFFSDVNEVFKIVFKICDPSLNALSFLPSSNDLG